MGKNNGYEKEQLFISELDQHLFAQGTHYEIYKKLGAHLMEVDGVSGVFFALWAPNAVSVSVVGDFNEWKERNIMKKTGRGGIFQLFIPGVIENALYKFLITTKEGKKIYKADPYACYAEYRPNTASIVANIEDFLWSDLNWLKNREVKNQLEEPISIYECHIGSFMRHPSNGEGYYSYIEFSEKIIPYLKEMGYTHIELMGITEYPYDGSWGYQVTGYYAPTSRYGTPKEFMYLINELHKNNIGVILDWVPAHFATDSHGLACFDGECIYEHPDPRLGEHPQWGTKIFNYGKNEVKNFLIANALYWLKEYHIDGIRVDAVASMLYLDYGREGGDWIPNKYGGNENLEAIEFMKHLNSILQMKCKGVITIAEESTTFPHVTGNVEDGLGFTFKWNMGWMHDFCEYMKVDPIYRGYHHNKLTFAMNYHEHENFILPISHDEVVHLKCSMVNKMPGEKENKYANLRAAYGFMFGHSGKKLIFMGQDFAQECEWSEKRELDWGLLDERLNLGMKNYVKDLLKLYKSNPALYELDFSWKGFEWINADDKERSVYVFRRNSKDKKKKLLFVINMTPVAWKNYSIYIGKKKEFELVINSDDFAYGGNGNKISCKIKSDQKNLVLDIPAFGVLIFKE